MTLRIIGGFLKGRSLKTPPKSVTRPTLGSLREAVFNIAQNEIQGARVLDVFAGSGAMGFEALSRVAFHATFVEQHPQAIRCIRENIHTLGLGQQSQIYPISVEKAIRKMGELKSQFEIVYIDPPYQMAFDLKDIVPLLSEQAVVFLETAQNYPLTHTSHIAERKVEPMDVQQMLPPPLVLQDRKKFGGSYLHIIRL